MHRSASEFMDYLLYSGKSRNTAYTYARIVDRMLNYVGKEPEDITRVDVMKFLRYLRDEKGHNDRYMAVIGWSLRSFFIMLGRRELAMWIPIPTLSGVEEPKWLPEDEVMKIVRPFPVLTVAYDLALRVGEVPLLRRDRYNMETGEIEVTRLKHKGRPNKYILVLRPFARDILNKYLRFMPRRSIYIFPMSTRNVQYIFKRALVLAGYNPRDYTFHLLRHSRLTNIAIKELREKGHVDLLRLSKFAGHLRPETTLRYVHLAAEYLSFH